MSEGQEARHGVGLRLARRARGLSQVQLAAMARIAFALASAMGMTIEELFGAGEPADPVLARPVKPLGGQGARVTLAPLGDGYVALPLQGSTASRAGFLRRAG